MPVQLRVDGKSASSSELQFALARQVGDTSEILLNLTVAGYLVDIPTS
jgi:hypothetical protein